MTKLGQLAIQIFINGIKALLKLLLRQFADGVMSRIVVDIGQKNCLGKRGSNVLPGAPIAVSACTYLQRKLKTAAEKFWRTHFVIERAVNTVLLCSKDICLDECQKMDDMQTQQNSRDETPFCSTTE